MKYRSDFVTNSSSSSFIMAYKDSPFVDEDTIEKYPFLKAIDAIVPIIFKREADESETAEVISTIEELREYIGFRYSWVAETVDSVLKRDSYVRNIYAESVEYLNKGYKIVFKDVDYDDPFYPILRKLTESNENLKLIEVSD